VKTVPVSLASAFYSVESLKGAAAAVGLKIISTRKSAGTLTVRLAAKKAASQARTQSMVREFLDEALSHEARSRTIKGASEKTSAVLAAVYQGSFLCVPWDPLEEMDAETAESRKRETARLLKESRK